MSIKNLRDLKYLNNKRENNISDVYKYLSPSNLAIKDLLHTNSFNWNSSLKCIELYSNNEWIPLNEQNMRKGQIRNKLIANKHYKQVESKTKDDIIKRVVEDISLFNLNKTELETENGIIYLANGIYNTNTKLWEEKEDIVDDYNYINFRNFIGNKYNPKAKKHDLMEKYLNLLSDSPLEFKQDESIILEQRDLKRRLLLGTFGLSMSFTPSRVIFNTYGRGGSGKSTFYTLLTSVINNDQNKKAIAVEYNKLVKSDFETNRLKNTTACFQTESIAKISPELLQITKQLASGGDEISFNEKFGAMGSMVNTAKPFINSNDILDFKDNSGAMNDRIVAISLNIGQDSEFWLTQNEFAELFPNGKLDEDARAYLIRLSIENFANEKQLKMLANSVLESIALKESIMETANPIKAWLEIGLEDEEGLVSNGIISAKTIYSEYIEYQSDKLGIDKNYVMSIQTFGKQILNALNDVHKDLGYWTKTRSGAGNIYKLVKKGVRNE